MTLGPRSVTRCVGVLQSGRLSRHEGILAVVDGVSIAVGEAPIRSASDAAIDRECGPVVIARGGALEFVDGSELRDRACKGFNARRPRTGQRSRELPGRERLDGAKASGEDRSSRIEDGIGRRDRLGQIHIQCPDQVFAVNGKRR